MKSWPRTINRIFLIWLGAAIFFAPHDSQASDTQAGANRIRYRVTRQFYLKAQTDLYTLLFKCPLPLKNIPHQTITSLYTDPDYNAVVPDPSKNDIAIFYRSNVKNQETVGIVLKYTVEREVVPVVCDPALIPADYSVTDESLQQYLREEENVNLYADQVQKTVNQTVRGLTSSYAKAKALYDFIVKEFTYENNERQSGWQQCLETLISKRGNCSDITKLYISLCRAAGIPARQVDGVVFIPKVPSKTSVAERGHAWAEIYLPVYGWLPVDPTFGISRKDDFFCFAYSVHIPESYGQVVSHVPGTLYRGCTLEWRTRTQTDSAVAMTAQVEVELLEGKPAGS